MRSLFQDKYQYYTLQVTADESQISCPVLNQNGEVVGIIQPSAGDQKGTSYAVSARFATDLKIVGLSINDPVFKQTQIPMAMPDDAKEGSALPFPCLLVAERERICQYG